MKVFVVDIEGCWKCPAHHGEEVGIHYIERCKLVFDKRIMPKIDTLHSVPKWCPLPDKH